MARRLGRPSGGRRTSRRAISVSRGTTRNVRAARGAWPGQIAPNPSACTVGAGNGALRLAAKAAGTGGDSIRARVVVAGASTALSVSVSGNDITVNSATTAGSAASSTANQIIAAINGNGPASALIAASLPTGSDGTGVTGAVGFTNLTGGRNPQ